MSPLSGRTYSGPRHPSHLYGSASSPECSSREYLSVAVDLGVSALGLLWLCHRYGFVTKQVAKSEHITIDLAFAGSKGASLQVVTEHSSPSSTSEPM